MPAGALATDPIRSTPTPSGESIPRLVQGRVQLDIYSKQAFALFDLPSELRGAIYAALSDQTARSTALLVTCTQVYMKASPLLYQRPVSFPSQVRLFQWMDRSRQHDLERVQVLSLRLTEIDISALYNPANGRSNSPTPWDLYQKELERLNYAFQRLPGLEFLTIVPPGKHNMFVRGMYESLLSCIAMRCPRLKRLTLHDNDDVLRRIPRLSQLTRVVCEGSPASAGASGAPSDLTKRSTVKGKLSDISIKMEEDADVL